MKLCDKIRYLREVEGELRGLGRAMTQGEMVRAIREEMNEPLSQSYLSQIESGARPHLTNTTRLLLAKFFNVHPGYLVDDPEGYHAELLSDLRAQTTLDEKLDLWLIGGAERFRRDPELRRALLAIAQHDDSRSCLLLLESILETPSLSERLLEVLRPEGGSMPSARKTPLLVSPEPVREKSAARGSISGKGSGNGSQGNGSQGNGVKSSQAKRGGSKR
ncbi:MAG TPA: transcriptional regulator [Acidobacteriaceae bacterium]|nr:transcriptional regulator [Acidobacteriaceae bacterium]